MLHACCILLHHLQARLSVRLRSGPPHYAAPKNGRTCNQVSSCDALLTCRLPQFSSNNYSQQLNSPAAGHSIAEVSNYDISQHSINTLGGMNADGARNTGSCDTAEAAEQQADEVKTQQSWDRYVAAQLCSTKGMACQAKLVSALQAELAQPSTPPLTCCTAC